MCFQCRAAIEHKWAFEEPMTCRECGWTTTWRKYLDTYQNKQLFGGKGYRNFLVFLEAWPVAASAQDKLLAIDRLIHACHDDAQNPMYRPAGVNLIEGNAHDVARLLDELAYSDLSTAGIREVGEDWQKKAEASGWRRTT
jgi:hypothetical protein